MKSKQLSFEDKKILVDFELVAAQKTRKMSRSNCPCCGPSNTFPVDQIGYLQIRLCLPCSKKEKFKVDVSKTIKCASCGEAYIPLKSLTCPVCWIKKFEAEGKWKK